MVKDTGERYHDRGNMIYALQEAGFKYGEDYEVMDVPNITNITYGRQVGYDFSKEKLPDEIEEISGTEIRDKMQGVWS